MKPKQPLLPSLEELRAEAAVNEILGTRRVDYDDQTENGKVDFLVDSAVGSAGPHVALEVSSTIDPARQRLWHGVDRHYAQTRSDLQGDWQVQFTADTQLKQIRARLTALLLRLECRNVDKIGLNGWDDSTPAGELPTAQHVGDLQDLARLNVTRAERIRSASAAGRIIPFEMNFGVARSNANTITPCLDGFLASQQGMNKVRKLARHPDREGHLFIWADPSDLSITMSLSHGFLPTDSPRVPPTVHTIWLGSLHADAAVYRWDRSGWTLHTVTAWTCSPASDDTC
ncbi:hypothetical protein [Streptomyces lunaelactis]|uniref:hypothetical protein n=1 Tax=Streptomyces lunaelactis TaxID=1535768 RepID=UPI00131F32A7|nr:hypothetical protein [Streptomyces lunaelactis]NUK25444.1 hypothetical protein [Streptomyces lunaelactis]NUK87296.1 hypothetical protein [Streptomyces lunaelactis]